MSLLNLAGNGPSGGGGGGAPWTQVFDTAGTDTFTQGGTPKYQTAFKFVLDTGPGGPSSATIDSVTLYCHESSAEPDDELAPKLWADDAGGSEPGTEIATGTSIFYDDLPAAAANHQFDFGTPPSVTDGVTYWIGVTRTAGSSVANEATFYYEASTGSSIIAGANSGSNWGSIDSDCVGQRGFISGN